ncbi:hypothetical protein C1645_834996 [Glomus cerebriforme]|uniref:DNA-directed DNA polymerase n=1 Tax=Glomus cerebriforme TaxID=658196 RepID=A0A397SIP4_9GLOM|nr:hypothetical protein C1645_834996 [Glomus cerebriforme]
MSLKPLSLEKITKWQYQYNKIKVNDMLFYLKHLKIPGCVAIDVCLCFMKLYSKAEKSSLAFYLNECGLESKMNMPFHRIFKYYRNALKEADAITAEQMCKIAEYYIIDALSCQRICNLLGVSAWQNRILTSTISIEQTETGKYPDAYIFPPIKGLKNRRSVTSLDFTSLYPNFIITYNLSPDKIILSEEQALSVEYKGFYANVLEYLFGKWNEMKKRLAPLKAKKEDIKLVVNSLGLGKSLSLSKAIEQVLANVKEEKYTGLTKNLYHFINQEKHEFMAEYDSVCFNCSCLDAKQYAFKVYMNTFYGTAGDNFIKNKRFRIKYGDTDSLYLVCLEESFQECDEAYNNDRILKEEYWSRMVEISMEEIEKLRDGVNKFFRKDNGSSYLKMAYEEVLFLIVFTGKKKYYGIPHKRKRIMKESIRVNNICTLHQIVEDVIKETINDISQKDLNKMIKTAMWRPDKNNKSDLTPESYLYEIPEPGERFEYIVVENDSSERMDDKMEYPEVLSSEIVLEALKKLKDGNKASNNKADDGGVDENDVDEENEDEMDEDEVSKIRDALVSTRLRKKLFDTTYADKEEHLTNNAYCQSFLNVLDKQEESIRLKLSSLLKEISEIDIGYREIVGLKITCYRTLSKLQDDKKDDSSEADIDEIIKLYG